tara:strand:+ start:62412 stop:64658 length:2247 start_codon:yes stop_codon:yes gene_type:complete
MVRNEYGYNLVQDFEKSKKDIHSLELIKDLKELYTPSLSVDGETLFTPSSTAFINTSELTKAAQYFEKNKVYTKADPIYDKYEYNKFWDEEEKKRKEGLSVAGELFRDKDGTFKLRQIHITGEHYGYLNYGRINRIPDDTLTGDDTAGIFDEFSQQTKAATKEVTFPDFWDGDYYYFKAIELARKLGKHLIVGKSRRKGYSYKNGWIAANRADLYPDSVTGIAAYDADSLYPKGTFSMADDYLQWIYEHTDWSKRRLRDSKEGYIKFGYKYKSSPSVERGYKSSIIAVPFGPAQPGALRGKDADLIIVEEAGKARNLADFLESTLPTLKAGKYVTGLMIVFGTGGGDENFWEAFEELFYDPESSDFLVFENMFDKDAEGEGAGFFMPDFINKEGFYDKHGNSIVTEAAKYEISIRKRLKEKGKIEKLKMRSMEYCFSPAEAFSRGSDNIFPKEMIEEQIARIKRNPVIKNIGRSGNLKFNDEGRIVFSDSKFMSDDEILKFHPPVNDLRLKPSKDNHGCFVQFQQPFRVDGKIPENLYRIWHDPFGVDKETKDLTNKHSFGCTYVYERVNQYTKTGGGRLVGVYIGRPETTDAYNDILYLLGKYYNAKIFYEKNVGNTYNHFRQLEELEMLVPEPKSIFDSPDIGTLAKVRYGLHINDQRKRNGAVYFKDWLLAKVDKDEHGNWKRNIHYIYDINLLRELLKWNLKGNFDRVSTMIVGMYDIKEQYFVEVEPPTPETNEDNLFERDWF